MDGQTLPSISSPNDNQPCILSPFFTLHSPPTLSVTLHTSEVLPEPVLGNICLCAQTNNDDNSIFGLFQKVSAFRTNTQMTNKIQFGICLEVPDLIWWSCENYILPGIDISLRGNLQTICHLSHVKLKGPYTMYNGISQCYTKIRMGTHSSCWYNTSFLFFLFCFIF